MASNISVYLPLKCVHVCQQRGITSDVCSRNNQFNISVKNILPHRCYKNWTQPAEGTESFQQVTPWCITPRNSFLQSLSCKWEVKNLTFRQPDSVAGWWNKGIRSISLADRVAITFMHLFLNYLKMQNKSIKQWEVLWLFQFNVDTGYPSPDILTWDTSIQMYLYIYNLYV